MSKDKKNTNNSNNTSKKSTIEQRKEAFRDNRELYKMLKNVYIPLK